MSRREREISQMKDLLRHVNTKIMTTIKIKMAYDNLQSHVNGHMLKDIFVLIGNIDHPIIIILYWSN